MFTTQFKILIAFIILLAIDAAVIVNQYNLSQDMKQLRAEVGYVVVTPIPTPTIIVTATPSATIAPKLIVKTPVKVMTVTPVVTHAVVK